MTEHKKTEQTEMEELKKELAASKKARIEAEEMTKSAIADAEHADKLRKEAERTSSRLRDSARLGAPSDNPNKPDTSPVIPEDIEDAKVREILERAQEIAPDYEDSPGRRRTFAKRAQDLLIALRELNVSYSGHAVTLVANKTPKTHDAKGQPIPGGVTKGDLYVYANGCHPRKVADRLAAGSDVADLVELVNELEAKLTFEATP